MWTEQEQAFIEGLIDGKIRLALEQLRPLHPITGDEVRELIGEALSRRANQFADELEQLRELIARLGGPGALDQVQADQVELQLTRQRLDSLELEQKERFHGLELLISEWGRFSAPPSAPPEAFQLLRDDIEHLHKLHNTRTELLGKFLETFDQIRLELKDQAVELRRRGSNSEILELLREMIGKIGSTATWGPDQEED